MKKSQQKKPTQIEDKDDLIKMFEKIKAGENMDEYATTDRHLMGLMDSMYATQQQGASHNVTSTGKVFTPSQRQPVTAEAQEKYEGMFGPEDDHLKKLFDEIVGPPKPAPGKIKRKAASLRVVSYKEEEDEADTLVPEYSSKTLMSRLDSVDCFNIQFSDKAKKRYPRDTFMQGVPVYKGETEEKLDITLDQRLGKGSFGQVWRGTTSSQEVVAVKQIELLHKRETAEKQYRQIKEEVRILKLLNHPKIVRYYGSFFHDHNMASIVMEFIAGGSVYDKLKTTKVPFTEDIIKDVLHQTLFALQYIHSKKVVHRDIKGQNLMLTPERSVRLVDFGCSKLVEQEVLQERLNSQSVCDHSLAGTCHWMAPEVINTEARYGTKSDIWSLGCTVYEMATLHPPYHALAVDVAMQAVLTGKNPPPALPSTLSQALHAFTTACLTRDKTQRPSASQLLQHEFIQQTTGAPKLAGLKRTMSLPH